MIYLAYPARGSTTTILTKEDMDSSKGKSRRCCGPIRRYNEALWSVSSASYSENALERNVDGGGKWETRNPMAPENVRSYTVPKREDK